MGRCYSRKYSLQYVVLDVSAWEAYFVNVATHECGKVTGGIMTETVSRGT